MIEIFERAGYRSYAEEMKKIAQLEGNDSDVSGKEHSQMEQPQTYPTLKPQPLSQVPPATAKSTEVYAVMEGKENLKEGKSNELIPEQLL